MSNDLHTLSGAYALDALSPEEAELFATHLEQCPACQDEVREFQQVAARLGAVESATPSSALKARILAAADQQRQLPPLVTPIEHARSRRRLPRVVAAAAAVVLIALGGAVTYDALKDSPTQQAATGSVSQVFKAPDARTATVTTSNGGRLRVATSARFGQMAVETQALPRLRDRSYQMWAIRNDRATSVGVINNLETGKVMPLPTPGTTVAITIEPRGGSKQPTRKPIVTMDPERV
jgi:anti-sigma-K factor RskA